jgi:hypothetical protein
VRRVLRQLMVGAIDTTPEHLHLSSVLVVAFHRRDEEDPQRLVILCRQHSGTVPPVVATVDSK